MIEPGWLSERFEEQRPRLRAVAFRILGSLPEADDAIQNAWVRVSGADAGAVDNLGGWLTTVVARVCLNMLRSRRSRPEEPAGLSLPDPVVSADAEGLPEEQALLAESVGLALLVVLDTLTPAERLAFVLHDVFDFPFEDIAPIVDRTAVATRQLASRARRRVRGAGLRPVESDRGRQRKAVDAFFSATRGGDIEALMEVLDPDVVLRADFGASRPGASRVLRGAAEVARSAQWGASLPGSELHPVLVNGGAGVIVTLRGNPFAIMGFVVAGGRIVEIDAIGDPERVARIARPVLAAG